VGGKTPVGLVDQLAVKASFRDARFAAAAEDDRSAFRIERKSKASDAIRCIKAQFLHIRMTRVLESIRARPPQRRTKPFKQFNVGQQLILHIFVSLELRDEVVVQINFPLHLTSMFFKEYAVKFILLSGYPARLSRHHGPPLKL